MSTSWFATMLFGLMLACPFFSQVIDTPIDPPIAVEPVQESTPPMIETELSIQGVVVEHINDCIFDGICAVVVETADGSQYQVIYAPGMMMCPNPNLDPNLSELVVGDQVEAYGEVLEDGSILLCNRDVYYLNKLAAVENELSIQGVVVEHINDCIFDGICAVVVETADGSQYQVIYAPGMMMCPNPNLDPNLSELVVGDQVEAFGEVLEDGSILLCNRDVYYLNKVTS